MPPDRTLGPLAAAVLFALGIAATGALAALGVPLGALPAPVIAAATLLVCIACVALGWHRPDVRSVVAALALVVVGAARGIASPTQLPPGTSVDDRSLDRVVGRVRGPVVETARGRGARLVPVGDGGGDDVWIWLAQPVLPGEVVAVTGRLRSPRGSLGIAQPDRAAALAARGARLELTVHALERIAEDPGPIDHAWRWAAATQARWSAAIGDASGDAAARAALQGIAVGDRVAVPAALDERWRAAGIFHVLSVSGLHLAVIAGLAYAFARRVVAGLGRVRPARVAGPIAIALAVGYTLVTGGQIATVRALVVVALVIVAAMLDRPVRLVDALGAAALVILAWRPAQLADPGFQLSFVAALTLALAPRPPRPIADERRRVRTWIVRGLAASAQVMLTTAPITAYHFHQITIGGVIGNLVLAPALELVALPLALGGLLIGWSVPITIASFVVGLVDRGAGLLATVVPVGHVVIANPVLAVIAVALSVGFVTRGGRSERSRIDVGLWLALCVVWALGRAPASGGELRVTFLDVGQGDAALVELPGGEVWLVDAGGHPNARGSAAASATGTTIRRTLAAYGHARIDLAILSHPHPDHYLGIVGLGVPIAEVWTADALEAAPTGELTDILDGLRHTGTRLVHPPLGTARTRHGVELVVHAPRFALGAHAVEAIDPVRTVNDNSLVVELRYRGRSILFAGDVEAEGEAALVEAGIGPVDVVKVAHHGSPTSSTAGFVTATRPALAVISCGPANQFGFPAPAVVARWEAVGADVVRTDRDGAITVVVDTNGALGVDRYAALGFNR